MTVQDALNQALQFHRSGKLPEAEAIYRQILAQYPKCADALHLLGVLAAQAGQPQASLELVSQAIAVDEKRADFHGSLAQALTGLSRYDEAVVEYDKAIALQPNLADAHNNLGIVLQCQGKLPQALESMSRAVQLQPGRAEYHFNIANVLKALGELDQAIGEYEIAAKIQPNWPALENNLGSAYRQKGNINEAVAHYTHAAELQPDFAEALSNWGEALCQKGEFDKALVVCRKALVCRPDFIPAYNNIGNALAGKEDWANAAAAFGKALSLRPDYAQAQINFANALFRQGKVDLAIAQYQAALEREPNFAEAHNSLGGALMERAGGVEGAAAAFAKAIELRPDYAEAHANLGHALTRLGQLDEAQAALRQAITLQHNSFDAHNNMGNVHLAQGDIDATLASYEAALALRPDDVMAHWNRAVTLLLKGDYERGWPEHEWRWRLPAHVMPAQANRMRPMWDGGDLTGKRILLHAEQGFGDAIQFARFVPAVVDRGGKVILAVHRELHRLAKSVATIDEMVAPDQLLPAHDVQCALMSLPLVFNTSLATIPVAVPYLSADPALAEHWRSRFSHGDGRKIGLAWAGRQTPRNEQRSLTLADLAPLSGIAGVRWVSLQRGQAGQSVAPGFDITDWTGDLRDFADTAALIDNLDLVITIDSAVAHLAGAMGKPVWVLLPRTADWRWLLNRTDSPWYPTARLFRQTVAGDWRNPIAQVVQSLGER